MAKLALVGCDIGYTRSPAVHAAIAEATGAAIDFDVFDVTADGLDAAIAKLFAEYDGFFITKPYKNDVKRYLNEVRTACGVNLVRCKDRTGFNTDGMGFSSALVRAFPDIEEKAKSALVLGAGGAAYSVAEALIASGVKVYALNRTLMNAVKMCRRLGCELYANQPTQLAVNCTSVGLHGEDVLASLCVSPMFDYAFDLIYDPPCTPFLKRCGEAGAATANGGDMLVYQAIEGDKLLLGVDAPTAAIFDRVNTILNGR